MKLIKSVGMLSVILGLFIAAKVSAQSIFLDCPVSKVGGDGKEFVYNVRVGLDTGTVEQNGKVFSKSNVTISTSLVAWFSPDDGVGAITYQISREDLTYSSRFSVNAYQGQCVLVEAPKMAF